MKQSRKSELEERMAWILDHLVLPRCGAGPYRREVRPLPDRKYTLDFAWEDLRLGIEVQGGVWCTGPAAHTRAGHVRDMKKLNLLQLHGWIVLQFSTDMLRQDPAGVAETVLRALILRGAPPRGCDAQEGKDDLRASAEGS